MGFDQHGDPRWYRNVCPGHAANAAVDRLEYPARRDPPGRLRGGENRAFARGALLFVVELIRFRPSVVHLHASTRGSFVRKATLFWISRPARVPVVVHMHGSGFRRTTRIHRGSVQAVIRATLCRASAFIALARCGLPGCERLPRTRG